jgi:transposase InsO family protein
MAQLGISGVTRAKAPRTIVPDQAAERPADRVDRDFTASRPNQLWVADFTHVPTWDGTVYVAFIVEVFSPRIVGWRAATPMTTPLGLDALEMALWTRRKHGITDLAGLVHHTDAGSQYTSMHFTETLQLHSLRPSIGTVGDAHDNALAETTIGLYKTECTRDDSPFRRGPLTGLAGGSQWPPNVSSRTCRSASVRFVAMSLLDIPWKRSPRRSRSPSSVTTKSAEVPSVTSVRIRSSCSLLIPTPSVALLIAPMAAPATPPITGTRNSDPSSRPQNAPHPVPRHVSSCLCSVFGFDAPRGQETTAWSRILTKRSDSASLRSEAA